MTDPVSGNLENVFEQGNKPTDKNDGEDASTLEDVPLFELQVAIPCKDHKKIAQDEKPYGD
jgi:hypothetical protein